MTNSASLAHLLAPCQHAERQPTYLSVARVSFPKTSWGLGSRVVFPRGVGSEDCLTDGPHLVTKSSLCARDGDGWWGKGVGGARMVWREWRRGFGERGWSVSGRLGGRTVCGWEGGE